MISKAKVRLGVNIARQALESAASLAANPHPLAFAHVGAALVSTLFNETDRYEKPCWNVDPIAAGAMARMAVEACVGTPVKIYQDGDSEYSYNGCRYGWNQAGWSAGPSGDPTALPRLAWEMMHGRIEVIVTNGKEQGVMLRADDMPPAKIATPTGDAVLADVKALRDQGSPVGALVHGPVGTGKSMIVRYVAREIGGFSIRARLSDIAPDTLGGLVEILAPRSLIVDDIDLGDPSRALDLIERTTAKGIVVLATTNEFKALHPGVRRSRRLGLHYEVERPDPEAVEALLGAIEVPDSHRPTVDQASLSAIADYASNTTALGPGRAFNILAAAVEEAREIAAERAKQ